MKTGSNIRSNELGATELLCLIISNWKLVCLFTTIGVLISFAATKLTTPIYESIAVIEVQRSGKLMKSLLPSGEVIVRRLSEIHETTRHLSPRADDPKLHSIEILSDRQQKGSDEATFEHLVLRVHSVTPKEGEQHLNQILSEVMSEINSSAAKGKNAALKLIEHLDNASNNLETEYQLLSKIQNNLSGKGSPDASALALEKIKSYEFLTSLKQEGIEKRISVLSVPDQAISFLKEPSTSHDRDPIKPRPLIWIAFGGVIGLFCGVFFALCRNFFEAVSRTLRES